mgnify:CR=1 FL=1
MTEVRVIGAGLAGSEAAWQLAERGFAVRLSEMKPVKMTPAHHCADFAELVCSNSLRGDRLENAVGLLKEELRRLGSLILQCADATRVEAGGCLAVDRYGFSGMVTERIRSHPNITVISEEVTEVPAGPVIIATGPLTSDAMSEAIGRYFGQTDYLHFFDAAAPLVTLESIDMTKAWYASRYDRGSADYINCAMTREEYQAFVRELAAAEEKELALPGADTAFTLYDMLDAIGGAKLGTQAITVLYKEEADAIAAGLDWSQYRPEEHGAHEDGCGCGEHGEDHECGCGHHHGEDHECCGGHGHDDGHECCCGHHHEE